MKKLLDLKGICFLFFLVCLPSRTHGPPRTQGKLQIITNLQSVPYEASTVFFSEEEGSLNIGCLREGASKEPLGWFDGAAKLKSVEEIQSFVYTRLLTLENLSSKDDGRLLTCKPETADEITQPRTIQLKQRATLDITVGSVVIPGDEYVITEGDNVDFKCLSSDEELVPSVAWDSTSTSSTSDESSSVLSFREVKLRDGGSITCRSNGVEGSAQPRTIKVEVVEKLQIVSTNGYVEDTNVVVNAGNDVQIGCIVTGNLTVSLTWYDGSSGEMLTSKEEKSDFITSSLLDLTDLDVSDSKRTFTCKSTGKEKQRTVELLFVEPLQLYADGIEQETDILSFDPDLQTSMKLMCKSTGKKGGKVTWWEGSREMSQKNKHTRKQQSSIVLLSSLAPSDDGRILECRSDGKEIPRSITLKAKGQMKLESRRDPVIESSTVLHVVGDTVNFGCSLIDVSSEKLSWWEGNEQLPATTTNNALWLTVGPLAPEDNDRLFTCQSEMDQRKRSVVVTTTDNIKSDLTITDRTGVAELDRISVQDSADHYELGCIMQGAKGDNHLSWWVEETKIPDKIMNKQSSKVRSLKELEGITVRMENAEYTTSAILVFSEGVATRHFGLRFTCRSSSGDILPRDVVLEKDLTTTTTTWRPTTTAEKIPPKTEGGAKPAESGLSQTSIYVMVGIAGLCTIISLGLLIGCILLKRNNSSLQSADSQEPISPSIEEQVSLNPDDET